MIMVIWLLWKLVILLEQDSTPKLNSLLCFELEDMNSWYTMAMLVRWMVVTRPPPPRKQKLYTTAHITNTKFCSLQNWTIIFIRDLQTHNTVILIVFHTLSSTLYLCRQYGANPFRATQSSLHPGLTKSLSVCLGLIFGVEVSRLA